MPGRVYVVVVVIKRPLDGLEPSREMAELTGAFISPERIGSVSLEAIHR